MALLHDDHAVNALDLLAHDHAEVDALFRKYDGMRHDGDQAKTAASNHRMRRDRPCGPRPTGAAGSPV